MLRSYSYDEFGNRLSMETEGETIDYTYNELNQLIFSSDGVKYSYDKRGNLTEVYKHDILTNQYEFDALNRLEKTINHQTSQSSVYRYNGLGHRTGKTIGDLELNPTKHIDDVLDITKQYHNLLQRTEGNKTTAYTWDTNLLLADDKPYLIDDLGSPIRFGEETYSYDEFGFSPNSTTQPFSFTGYQTDEVAGTLFAQAREYIPNVGRFTAKDLVKGHIAQPITLNAYLYCINNPVKFIDPDGLTPVNAEVYANAMGADVTVVETRDGSRSTGVTVTRTATITYGGDTQSFTLGWNNTIDYSVLNDAFGWENPWIPNGETYSAFLGSHPSFNSPWHHSSLVVFALLDCPIFGGHELFEYSFSNVNYMAIGGSAEKGLFNSGQWGILTGDFNNTNDVNLSIKNEMLPLNIAASVIFRLIQNTRNFENTKLTYALTPAAFSNSYNSGSFLAGLLRSVGIFITPGPNSPGWDKPVPLRYFRCEEG